MVYRVNALVPVERSVASFWKRSLNGAVVTLTLPPVAFSHSAACRWSGSAIGGPVNVDHVHGDAREILGGRAGAGTGCRTAAGRRGGGGAAEAAGGGR